MIKNPDIDIDFKNRDEALKKLYHVPASIVDNGSLKRHNVGIYLQNIPTDPMTGLSSIPYKEAEKKGYFKIDFLNLTVYNRVRDEDHLECLINTEPYWEMLEEESIVQTLFQISNHFPILDFYKPKTVEQLAMVIAMIRPAKARLIGEPWDVVEQKVWIKEPGEEYGFKKSHAIAYSMVIVVEMNLLLEDCELRDTDVVDQAV